MDAWPLEHNYQMLHIVWVEDRDYASEVVKDRSWVQKVEPHPGVDLHPPSNICTAKGLAFGIGVQKWVAGNRVVVEEKKGTFYCSRSGRLDE